MEHHYISKDYLVDFASCYSSCFDDYPKKCNRIHFFSSVFPEADFDEVIIRENETAATFWEWYLGFIVAKPIPLKVIGKTVLKIYPKKVQILNVIILATERMI